MRVVTLVSNLQGVGTYRRCFNFSRELARRGHEVTMCTVSRVSRFGSRAYFKNAWIGEHASPVGAGPWVRVVEGPRWLYRALPGWGSGPLDIGRRLREVLRLRPDVIVAFEYQPNVSWPVYLTRPVLRYGLVSDWCDWFAGVSNRMRGSHTLHAIDRFFEERIRHVADVLTVTSGTLYQRALDIGVLEDRIFRIPEGVDTEYIRPLPEPVAREDLPIAPGTPLLATVQDTDMRTAVRVFRDVLRRVPEARLLIVGQRSPATARAVTEFDVGHAVVETGWVTDEQYARYLAAADVCFLHLEDDLGNRARWPAKVNDYLAAGRATVVSRVGDLGRLAAEDGVAVTVTSPEEMVDAVEDLLGRPEERARLGAHARRAMEEKWDWRHRGEVMERAALRAREAQAG